MVLVHVDQHNNSLQQVFGIVKLLVGLLNDLVVQVIKIRRAWKPDVGHDMVMKIIWGSLWVDP